MFRAPLLRLVVALGLLLVNVQGACQGLYMTQPVTGQMQMIDWMKGNITNIGPTLASQGWIIPDCTPAAIDTTGKWYYTLARNSSLGASSPWVVVAARLIDGTVRKSEPLPPSFPASLLACQHTFTADGSWHVFISAVYTNSSTGVDTLISGRYTFTWPWTQEYVEMAHVPVSSLKMGSGVAIPSSVVTEFHLWIQLERGLVGINLTSLKIDRQLQLDDGYALTGLQYDRSVLYSTYGILNNETASVLASFVDNGVDQPVLNIGKINLPPQAQVGLGALLNDKTEYAIVSGVNLTTVDLAGNIVASVPVCLSGCPSSLAYEPFVF
jgi:hypothetical protein